MELLVASFQSERMRTVEGASTLDGARTLDGINLMPVLGTGM